MPVLATSKAVTAAVLIRMVLSYWNPPNGQRERDVPAEQKLSAGIARSPDPQNRVRDGRRCRSAVARA